MDDPDPDSPPDVYVVEDDPRLLTAIAGVLEEVGFVVRAFGSADAARARVEDDRPRVIVTDEQLPGMAGHELMREVRAALAHDAPRFLLVTGADVPRSVLSGFDGVLYKPFRLDELLAQTRRLGQRRHRSATMLRKDVRLPSKDEDESVG